jgi:hypothetical protein
MSVSMENAFAEVKKKAYECLAAMRVGLVLMLAACGVGNPKVSLFLCHFHFTDILRLSKPTTFEMFCFRVRVFVGSDYTV